MILRRYITWQVISTTALVLGFLVVMLLGGRLIRYFGMAAEGGLQVSVLFRLISYNLPYFLELILPLSFFIALILTFGRLYTDNEMAVINGSGVSRSQLGRLLTPVVVCLVVAEGYLSLVAKPWGVRQSENIWQNQALLQAFDLIKPKSFISSGDYHLYVGEVGENRSYVSDVMIVQSPKDNSTKQTLIFAKHATQVPRTDNVVQLDLSEGRRYEIDTASLEYNEIGFERYRVSLETKSGRVQDAKIETEPTTTLLTQSTPQAQAELGYRLSLPWLMVLAVMFALPLSQVRPRQGRWLKLVPSIFIFVAVALVLISLKSPIEKQRLGVWAYPVVLVVMFLVALYLNYHTRLITRYRLTKHEQGEAHG
ncbi:MAG: LPS export ABC transporter permease LptF [Moraxella sp.]|nr:LPS export ABC transporter permease LptF [Moraxella sp.]